MSEIKYKIITCEECYNIPKIIILSKDKIQIECSKCNKSKIENISYFNKYIEPKSDNFPELPKCSYNINHETQSIYYCLQCTKYLCPICVENHKISFDGKSHILVDQRMDNQYYCNKKGHEEFIYNGYCLECQKYLCSQCKCEHKNIYYFEDLNNKQEIKEIIKKVKECEQIIEKEEEKVKGFIKELVNKIQTIKKMFEEYKNRNMKVISFYKILIDNYEKINPIRNYNINNNITSNYDLDLSNSDYFISDKSNFKECISSKFNRLCCFYTNKNHIKTKQYSYYNITKKFCGTDKVKKCIFLDKNKIIFIFNNDDQNIYYLFKDEDSKFNKYEMKKLKLTSFYLKDLIPLEDNKFISLSYGNDLSLYKISNNNNISKEKEIKNANHVIIDVFNKNNFFIVENSHINLKIKYYDNNNNKDYLLYIKNKKNEIKYIYENINEIINLSNIKESDKENLKHIFTNTESDSIYTDTLYEQDNALLKYIDEYFEDLYNDLKEIIGNDGNENNINSNYIYHLLKEELEKQESLFQKENIQYIFELNEIINKIRKTYIIYLITSSKIYNIYNFNNNSLIFMGEKYLFFNYSLKDREFSPVVTLNFLSNNENEMINYKNYEIKSIYMDNIILNNNNKKVMYIINGNNIFLIKKKYDYFSNIIVYDKYILFDNIKENELQFSLIDLSKNSYIENSELGILLNFKIDNNYPEILSWNFKNKFINLFENNQICITEYKLNDKEINFNNIPQNVNKIILKPNYKSNLIPITSKIMGIYGEDYLPSMMFNSDSYYCSKKSYDQHFEFDFKKEYYFLQIEMIFHEDYKDCMPRTYTIQFFDKNKTEINEYIFVNDNKKNLKVINDMNESARFMRFNFIDNFGGEYIIIKNMKFKTSELYDIV